jgi:hypothetical protein
MGVGVVNDNPKSFDLIVVLKYFRLNNKEAVQKVPHSVTLIINTFRLSM